MKTCQQVVLALAVGILPFYASTSTAQQKAIGPYPTVSLRDIPQPLQELYMTYKPEMNAYSHCAAAFDGHTDGEKMAFRCSIYIKMSAEGERRAMHYCEEKRAEHKINAPCRLIVEP